jgi:hypothetical protein
MLRFGMFLAGAVLFVGGFVVSELINVNRAEALEQSIMSKLQQPIKEPKDAQFSHGFSIKVRKFNEADFSDKTTKFGVEVYYDANTGNYIYISENGNLSIVKK